MRKNQKETSKLRDDPDGGWEAETCLQASVGNPLRKGSACFAKEFEPLTGEQVGTIGSLHLGDMLQLEILVH